MSNKKTGAAPTAAPSPEEIIDTLTAENTALKAENEKLAKELEEAKNEVADAKEYVEELKDQLKDSGSKENKGPVITIGKEKYRVTKGMRTKDGALSPSDIAADLALCKKLVEKNSTIVVKL
ncbi:hypothetical protein [Mongoliibacter ruber]|uniref:Uncharacterized protein n=1 Tax=Mongoliibacter ruber TaxID=1750599 RepID=A0A2T0WV89_9BACT|nr:hypothetical protein [Mongoliibacter ruber]PRY90589.1 hypothetical protein CLW00_101253 [Mongoliibacter ruber]